MHPGREYIFNVGFWCSPIEQLGSVKRLCKEFL